MEPRRIFLMYHELEVPGRPLCQSEPGYVRYVLRVSDFQAQMQCLKASGSRGVCTSEALSFKTAADVAITFDDGSETDLLQAAPVLRTLGFGATFYITSGFLGRRGFLSVAQVRELAALGFEIGCHSMTHAYLPDLDAAGLHREIVEAKEQLEQLLGKPVEHYSCPGGRCDQRAVQTSRAAGYRTLAASLSRANSESADRFALGRVAIKRDMTLGAFQRICRGQGLWRLRLTDLPGMAAKRLLGNSGYDALRDALLGRGTSPGVSGKPGT